MSKYIITYATIADEWESMNTIVATGTDIDEVEENLERILVHVGVDAPTAREIVTDGLYYIRNDTVDYGEETDE